MSEQIHAQKSTQPVERPEPVAVEPVAQDQAMKVSQESADLLDEIDEILETNAAEFVAAYIQKGGQ